MSTASLNEQMDTISVGIEEIVPQEQLESQISKSINDNQSISLRNENGLKTSKLDWSVKERFFK